MSGTFLCPNTCGFAKVVALEVSREVSKRSSKEPSESPTRFKSRVKSEEYGLFQSYFTDTSEGKLQVNPAHFAKHLPSLKGAFNRWNTRKLHEKSRYLEHFSLKNWCSLSTARKKEHTFSNCKGCSIRYAPLQALFPVRSVRMTGKARLNPVFSANVESEKLRSDQPSIKPTQNDAKHAAKAIYDAVAPQFENIFKQTFAQALCKNTKLNLQNKTQAQRRMELRKIYTRDKENMENHMNNTSFLR